VFEDRMYGHFWKTLCHDMELEWRHVTVYGHGLTCAEHGKWMLPCDDGDYEGILQIVFFFF
jgi:hypothetical protein